ncbi:MAG: extracellular solute-binding protein [Opitutales bacterium]|nr:extracellular solute-binding protein [Opitutales bacterium]NRA28140.1 extracellular solute-binding protein [Opitutales bacterium]
MRIKGIVFGLGLLGVFLVPFCMQERVRDSHAETGVGEVDRVIVVSPHNEAIRYEFGQAFEAWYLERTGRVMQVDWRVIGGTSEIVRKVQSDYVSAFRQYWTEDRGQVWCSEIQRGFMNRRLLIDETSDDDTPVEAARRAFLASQVGCGIDVFFGGGSYDFSIQAAQGTLVSTGLLEKHPQWFTEDAFPMTYSGEDFWDPEGRWFGAVLSTFGIIYNRDSLERLGIESEPAQWPDLADPRLFGEVALADPTKSGSITRAFELLIQSEIFRQIAALSEIPERGSVAEMAMVELGWTAGLQLIVEIASNARYFTDSSTKPSLDVSQGDCAIGMSIDFYGRQQAESINQRGGVARFDYVAPEGGSSVSVDPIAVFRGAPNAAPAALFVEFVMSPAGQKLWNFKPGTPGGPERYALRRSPVQRFLFEESFKPFRSDPEVNDYEIAKDFVYRPEWTGRLFSPIRVIIRAICLDPFEELREARRAIIHARAAGRDDEADAATAIMLDISPLSYSYMIDEFAPALRKMSEIEGLRTTRELTEIFRERYHQVVDMLEE